jgi:hypothetical protein
VQVEGPVGQTDGSRFSGGRAVEKTLDETQYKKDDKISWNLCVLF